MKTQNESLSMIKEASRAVLVCGILLLILGINAHNSSNFDISRFFADSATDNSIWMLPVGAAAIVLGIVGWLRRPKIV